MSIRILRSAVDDLDAGRGFYESRQEGLGGYFLDALFSDIDVLLLHAEVHQQYFGYYRALSRRFPYAAYYRIDGTVIEVWCVLDCRRKPSSIRGALKAD